MMSFRRKLRPTEAGVFVQAAILGFLFGEIWYLAQSIGFSFNKYIHSSGRQEEALIAGGVTALITALYFYSREGLTDVKRLWRSRRFDLLVLVALGFLVSVSVGGVGTDMYQEYVGKIDVLQLMLVAGTPVVIALMLMLKAARKQPAPDSATPFFFSDRDITEKKDDLLNLSERAARFAEAVLNGGSADSLVFGIDAPWGIGKSSFVNFCCEYWDNSSTPQIIVHRFEPLRYEDSPALAEKFVNDLVNTIQRDVFIPEIRPLFSKYSRLIKGKSSFSFFGVQFALEPGTDTVEGTLESLDALLTEFNKKVIVVVDDLDRLNWSAIKNILFAIKRSFMLPNVSYVLCYDTENIALTDEKNEDGEKVREFLEKFVNVKISLFLDSSDLGNYFSTNFKIGVQGNLDMNPKTLHQIEEASEELQRIFQSHDFFHYQDFLGDIRKLKRLINTMLLFEIEKTDFQNSDFNKEDLIHLLLVYVNYPNIFRKIYNTEAGGKNGFFSLVFSTDLAGSIFKNSENYLAYVKTLTANQKFLLQKLFGDKARDLESADPGTRNAFLMSRACFNGEGDSSRNLERYLNLIVKLSKPDKHGYQLYVRKKDELLHDERVEKIFGDEELDFSKGDFARGQLWNVIVNSSKELKPGQGPLVISYLMRELPDFSLLEVERIGIGSRKTLIFSLLKLLDNAAWESSQTGRRNNNKENISEIADWVFGEGSHTGNGVLGTLAKPERGPLGLFDLMLFRLYCSADRSTGLFNLQRALTLHGNPSNPTSGPVIEIAKEEMREISQRVFVIFKNQYINGQKNLFQAIDDLNQDDLAAKSSAYLREEIESGKVKQNEIDQLIAVEKSRLKVFIVYQLGTSRISNGVGCGFYDETGTSDAKGIATRVNEYLFDHCFNPAGGSENLERFLDYLMMSYELVDGDYEPTLEGFTKVLEIDRLREYWKAHKTAILGLNLTSKEKSVITSNYNLTYEHDLPALYAVLNELVIDTDLGWDISGKSVP